MLLVSQTALVSAKPDVFPGQNRKWNYYQSPNFELYSTNGDRDSRDVLEKMELLRAVFLDTFKLTVRLPQPVTLYCFNVDDDFNSYMPVTHRSDDVQYAGFCFGYTDRTVITLAPARNRAAASEVVYHEYIHHLFRVTEQTPAPWFNEGTAELFSTMQEVDDSLHLGQPSVGRVYELLQGQLMPFEELFAVTYDSPVFRDSTHSGIFYAQSWAFLHYCRYGVNGIPQEKLAAFLRAASSPKVQEKPEEFRALCKDLLGYDYPQLLRVVRSYISDGRFAGRKVPRPPIAAKSSYQARAVTPEEMKVRLAELSLRVTQSAYANWFVRDQVSRQPDIRLQELLGMVALRENQTESARAHWNQAVELGTTNAAIFRELSRLEGNQVFSQFDLDYRLADARTEQLRKLLARSIECAPAQSLSYEMMAWVEATASQPRIASINLVQKRFSTLNDKPRTLLALTMVRFRLGEIQEARELLDQLDKLNPDQWVAYCAEITRARIENRPLNPEKIPVGAFSRSDNSILLPSKLELPR